MPNVPYSALEISNLSHQYGSRTALNAVSFTMFPGEILGLLGPNGSGKTTLFKIISTLISPANGSVRVFGHDVVLEPDLVRRKIGVVFQSPALDLKLRVDENLQSHHVGCPALLREYFPNAKRHIISIRRKLINQQIIESEDLDELKESFINLKEIVLKITC